MAQLLEANQVGKPDSWEALIANIEAEDCPYSSTIRKASAPNQVEHNWQVEKYRRKGHTGLVDGKDADDFATTGRERLQNISQWVRDNPSISAWADESDIAGMSGEMARQIVSSMVTVKWMIEDRCLSDSDCQADDGATAGNETRGIFSWSANSAQAKFPVPEAYRPGTDQIYSGTLADFTETDFLALQRAAYKKRRGTGDCRAMLGVDLKSKFSDMGSYQVDVSGKTAVRQTSTTNAKDYVRCIDKLVLDTGTVDLFLNPHIFINSADGEDQAKTHRSGIFYDDGMVSLAYVQKPNYRALENKGGGPRGICETKFHHKCDNPSALITCEISADS